jgi:hypothetical protein
MTPSGTDPYEKWPAIGLPPVRGPEPLYGRIRAEKAPTRQQPALTPEAEAGFLRDREEEELPRRVPGATLRAKGAAGVIWQPPPLEDMTATRDALRRKLADAAIVPEIPDTPAELLAMPAPEQEPEGWREWLAAMAWGAARHAEPPGRNICAWCRESIAGWCDPCADSIELAAALDALHDEILTAPDLATAQRLMVESASWRTTHGEATGGGK